ncbi:TPA: hypothetical protein N0F65_000846 [Lagenidium giganteum]|uniref:Pleiotropic regulator 1 n=1 Tax=Lagenidium giganteum TaxID=4803 RepID=A0AAV2YYK2_9STRA|nr:TPA: hypothetical protein N0F65_000846 [Lagenidium giganteum]
MATTTSAPTAAAVSPDTDGTRGLDSHVEEKIQQSVLRTAELFALSKRNVAGFEFAPSKKVRICTKLNDTFFNLPESLLEAQPATAESTSDANATTSAPTPAPVEETDNSGDVVMGGHAYPSAPGVSEPAKPEPASLVEKIVAEAEEERATKRLKTASQGNGPASAASSSAVISYKAPAAAAAAGAGAQQFGSALVRRRPTQVPKPTWHAPWKLKRVISGHLGWVRAIAVDPTNDWFVTGAADRTIKIWDLASGQLKLTLTGHINCIRGLEVSARHPYLFSAAEDKKVLCWDLEYNKVIRSYHGHLSGVFSLKLHPTLDVLVTGGRDAVARVWDMRSKQQIHVLSGHQGTVWSMETQSTDPQVITGSSDSTVKLWDLAAGKVMTTLTNHKKAVRAIAKSPIDRTFMSGAADNMKKWDSKDGSFLRNYSGHNAIINSLAINRNGVMVSSADNGSMQFWDYQTGYCFQKEVTKVQPGSLDSEAGVYASAFDYTGLRFITCEADKTIKVWAEDADATESTHPIDMTQWTKDFTAPKRY